MKSRPILFSAPMVRAILEGRKTMTRRVIKSRDSEHYGEIQSTLSAALDIEDCNGAWRISGDNPTNYGGEVQMNDWQAILKCPYGQPGDELWVRETWRTIKQWDHLSPSNLPIANNVLADVQIDYLATPSKEIHGKTRVSIHMPKWAARIYLDILNIRVERLQDISEADAIAEGLKAITKDFGKTVKWGIPDRDGMPGTDNDGWEWSRWNQSPVEAYRELWESINGAGSWSQNPFVWIIEFKKP